MEISKLQDIVSQTRAQQTIDVEGFSAGCCHVQIMLDNGKINTAKFIKE